MQAKAWSYSALDSFETCPRRHYLTKVSKEVVEQQTEQMKDGLRVHKALELRLTKNVPLPVEMQSYEVVASTIANRAKGGVFDAEQKLCLSADYRPVSFFDKAAWVRGIIDFTIVKGDKVFIGDYKTGVPKPNSAQLRLTAAMVMHCKPWVQKAVNSFVWLKTGGCTTETITRADVPVIWQEFAPRVQRFQIAHDENKFPPRPSGLCRKYCPVGKAKCEHCGE